MAPIRVFESNSVSAGGSGSRVATELRTSPLRQRLVRVAFAGNFVSLRRHGYARSADISEHSAGQRNPPGARNDHCSSRDEL